MHVCCLQCGAYFGESHNATPDDDDALAHYDQSHFCSQKCQDKYVKDELANAE